MGRQNQAITNLAHEEGGQRGQGRDDKVSWARNSFAHRSSSWERDRVRHGWRPVEVLTLPSDDASTFHELFNSVVSNSLEFSDPAQ